MMVGMAMASRYTGDKTLAQNLINAGKPVPLIIGDHSHTDLSAALVGRIDSSGTSPLQRA